MYGVTIYDGRKWFPNPAASRGRGTTWRGGWHGHSLEARTKRRVETSSLSNATQRGRHVGTPDATI